MKPYMNLNKKVINELKVERFKVLDWATLHCGVIKLENQQNV